MTRSPSGLDEQILQPGEFARRLDAGEAGIFRRGFDGKFVKFFFRNADLPPPHRRERDQIDPIVLDFERTDRRRRKICFCDPFRDERSDLFWDRGGPTGPACFEDKLVDLVGEPPQIERQHGAQCLALRAGRAEPPPARLGGPGRVLLLPFGLIECGFVLDGKLCPREGRVEIREGDDYRTVVGFSRPFEADLIFGLGLRCDGSGPPRRRSFVPEYGPPKLPRGRPAGKLDPVEPV